MAKGRFENIINSDKPVLVDFYADWCAPCKMVAPILKEIKDEWKDGIRVVKVNVDRNPAIANSYNIQNIPTLIVFKDGVVAWKGVGVKPASEIRKALANLQK